METPGDGHTGRLYVAPRTSIPGRARRRVTARPEACELDVYTAATVRQTIGALRVSIRRVGTGQYSHGQRDGGRPYSPSDDNHATVPNSTCIICILSAYRKWHARAESECEIQVAQHVCLASMPARGTKRCNRPSSNERRKKKALGGGGGAADSG